MRSLIVTCADQNYIDQAKQFFSSIFWSAEWPGDVMLITEDMADTSWFEKRGIIVIRFKNPARMISGLDVHPTYLKLNLFQKKFQVWDRIIYLDSDSMVIGDIAEILRLDNFYAVKDHFNIRDQFKIIPKGMIDGKAFNAGFFAFSTEILNSGLFKKSLVLLNEQKDNSRFFDQPILNMLFYRRWKELPLEFNINPYTYRYTNPERFFQNVLLRSKVLHFSGKKKPWDRDDLYFRLWNHYLKLSGKIDFNLDHETIKKRIPKIRLNSIAIRQKLIWEWNGLWNKHISRRIHHKAQSRI